MALAASGRADKLTGLRNIGTDKLSYRRHHEYLTIVTDHDEGRVAWATPRKNADTVPCFSSLPLTCSSPFWSTAVDFPQ